MKKQILVLAISTLALTGCLKLSPSVPTSKKGKVEVWVGAESVDFYKKEIAEYQKEHKEFTIEITGADTGTTAGLMLADNSSCADIVTIYNDNIGKLALAETPLIQPITNNSLLHQISDDNPSAYQNVIRSYLGEDRTEQYVFGVPYISQALFLYYNTRYVSSEESQTFEGLQAAAKRYDSQNGVTGTKAVAVTSTDGFNFSFTLLARNLTRYNTSTLRLYENGEQMDCYNQSNDNVAIMKWAQRFTADTNGLMLETYSRWESVIQAHEALSIIGGVWHYNLFKEAVGEDNMGCAIIPTFTLTSADIEGIEEVYYPDDVSLPEELRGKIDTVPAIGTVYRGGSFVDCKCFAINAAKVERDTDKYNYVCDLMRFLSSKEEQKRSYLATNIIPAYAGADEFIESTKEQVDQTVYLMAKAQAGMSSYGIAQPFTDGKKNTNYYSRGTPDMYRNCVLMRNNSGTDVYGIRKVLWSMEYIWKKSAAPEGTPNTLPYQTTDKFR